ncbi:hypothetical protein DL96DRAFT_1709353 [Flagelloscypha sp. PMI_526]|nr:hypothetical protein DL96DRAFT_1709353 [Flagelloscypha sp. PMI_526]
MSEPASSSSVSGTKRHALTPTEKIKVQLDKLSKDPAKPAFIPAAPQEKTIRAPREMMKNVQGSSAGAGSGEFHVYKAGRRREYERLAIMQEQSAKEIRDLEFAQQKQEAEAALEAKTAKNRAKRQKKKEARGKAKATTTKSTGDGTSEAPFKKRRLIDGSKELMFRKPGEDSDEHSDEDAVSPSLAPDTTNSMVTNPAVETQAPIVEVPRITIHED